MKVLLVADLHYDLRKFDWVVEAADHVDAVVLAGDHLDPDGRVPLPAQAVVVQRYFQLIRAKRELLAASGNSDVDAEEEGGEPTVRWLEKARYLGVAIDGDAKSVGDNLFTVCPWWEGAARQEAAVAQLAFDSTFRPGRWWWVCHVPPSDSATSRVGGETGGHDAISAWVEKYQPDIVLSGHVHEAPFRAGGSWVDRLGRTWLFNAGVQIGPVPSAIVIDTDTDRAFWLSERGRETVDLRRTVATPVADPGPAPDWVEAIQAIAARYPV